MDNTTYIQGERISFALSNANYAAVTLRYGSASVAMTLAADKWTATVDSSALSGNYRFAILADGKAVEAGAFYVKQLVSKYRAVVEAIDAALQGVATNGKYSITVGEISLTDKTFDEMVKARNYYERLADADENGVTPTHGPKRVSEVYE